MRPIIYKYAPLSTTNVALSQAVVAGSAMVLNPNTYDTSNIAQSQVVFDSANPDGRSAPGYTQRSGSLTSTGNVSAVNFTFVGLDMQSVLTSQAISGPNNNTVYTSAIFSLIQSVTPSTGYTSGVSAGMGADGRTKVFIPSTYAQDFDLGFGVYVSGAVTYTVRHTHDNTFSGSWSTWRWFNHDDSSLVNATTSQNSNYAFPVGGIEVYRTDTGTGGFDVIYRQSWV